MTKEQAKNKVKLILKLMSELIDEAYSTAEEIQSSGKSQHELNNQQQKRYDYFKKLYLGLQELCCELYDYTL